MIALGDPCFLGGRERNKTQKFILRPLKKSLALLGVGLKEVIYRVYLQKKGSFKDPFLLLALFLIIVSLFFAFSPILFSGNFDSSFLAKSLRAQLLDPPEDSSLSRLNSQSSLNSSTLASNPNPFEDSPDLILVQKDSLRAVSSPALVFSNTFGTIVGQGIESNSRREIIEYRVQSGDTVSSVAEKFGISLETLIWANDLTKNSKLKNGQTLIILPISGVLHYVKKGENLSQVAQNYKSEVSKIVAFNELANEDDIYIGDILVIPDGKMPPKQQITGISPPSQITIPSSYFILPVASPYRISQGLHWYNAVDLSHPGGNGCGRPVFAAAAGQIVRAKVGGWNAGSGNNISILHPNQVVTAYYHLGAVLVQPGQMVSAGEQIGTISNSGKTTGCHLHFEVRGAANPFIR